MYNIDLNYLYNCLQQVEFIPYLWSGEDKNLAAFSSKEEFIAWYCQPPGTVGQPYKDRGFYCRELAMLSRLIKPRVIVEFGTSLGIGTCLLRWLNPDAHLLTVDINTVTFMPGDIRVPMGCLARWQKIKCCYVTCNSWEFNRPDVDLCFIDADHSYEAVKKDSERAWLNKSSDHIWAIAWHDHNNRHPGVMQAVTEFCASKDVILRSRSDSDTVWIMGGNNES